MARGDASSETPAPEPDLPPSFQAQVNEQGFLMFASPSEATPEAAELTADIVDLDHRIHRRLGHGSSDWAEVMGVLTNAANMLTWGRLAEARELYARAQRSGGLIWKSETGCDTSRE